MYISEEEYRNAFSVRIETLSDDVRQEMDPFRNDQKELAEEAIDHFQETGNFAELFKKLSYMQFLCMGYDEIAAMINIFKHTLQGYEEVLTSYNLSDVTREKLMHARDYTQRCYELYKTRLEK